jgi:fumarate reductase flavoprotein subunit
MNGKKETDVVVIGSGATGLTAALAAAEEGVKVTIFEKQRALGGTSNFFHGVFAVESSLQVERYIEYSRDQAFKNIMEYSHWRANARLVRVFVNESAPTLAWLQKNGIEFTDATTCMPDTPRTYHVVKGDGAAIIKALATRAKAKGADIKPVTPVKRIFKEGNKISGVLYEEDGEEFKLTAKAVIIATGGYGNNKEWIKKYTGYNLGVNIHVVGNTDKTGDGIRMAWDVGAAEEGLGVVHILRIGPVGAGIDMGSLELPAIQPCLWVSPNGERFCNEEIAPFDTSAGNINARFNDGYTFSIFDDSFIQILNEKGIVKGVGPACPPGTSLKDYENVLKYGLANAPNEIFSANSISELAKNMGIKPEVLTSTIDQYNRSCEKGYDELFAKNRKYLWPLKGPRFYAMRAHTAFLGTLGGIKINHSMQVVDKNENAIPGLYAGGTDTGGMWGDSYSMDYSAGACSAFALTSGRIAGKNAVQQILGR